MLHGQESARSGHYKTSDPAISSRCSLASRAPCSSSGSWTTLSNDPNRTRPRHLLPSCCSAPPSRIDLDDRQPTRLCPARAPRLRSLFNPARSGQSRPFPPEKHTRPLIPNHFSPYQGPASPSRHSVSAFRLSNMWVILPIRAEERSERWTASHEDTRNCRNALRFSRVPT